MRWLIAIGQGIRCGRVAPEPGEDHPLVPSRTHVCEHWVERPGHIDRIVRVHGVPRPGVRDRAAWVVEPVRWWPLEVNDAPRVQRFNHSAFAACSIAEARELHERYRARARDCERGTVAALDQMLHVKRGDDWRILIHTDTTDPGVLRRDAPAETHLAAATPLPLPRDDDWALQNTWALRTAHTRACARSPHVSWVLFAPWRSAGSPEENWMRYQVQSVELSTRLARVTELAGHYGSADRTTHRSVPWLFASEVSLETAHELHATGDQPIAVWGGLHTMVLLGRGRAERDTGTFHPGLIAQAISEACAPNATFLGFERPRRPTTQFGALGLATFDDDLPWNDPRARRG